MCKQKTTEEFIIDAQKVHGDKYDYSLVEYVGNKKKVKIICKKHGVFEQSPNHHLKGENCSKCAGKYMDGEYFNEMASKIHDDKYDYSLVKYIGGKKKIKIICPKHGIFEQIPNSHLMGRGCSKCGGQYNPTTSEFIEKAKKIHDNKYDYSLVDYKNNRLKIKIICPKHGKFEQTPDGHLRGDECPKCSGTYMDGEYFNEMASKIHNNKYDYSLVDYKNSKLKVKIICPEHGIFEQIPNGHLMGQGCIICGGRNKSTTYEFIERAKKIHNDKYDYSLVNYVNTKSKIKIICPVHGVFEQKPDDHLSGCGCRLCRESKGEIIIKKYLDEKCIKYIREKAFEGCKNKLPLHFDYYLYEYNKLLEYDGEQHFKVNEYFGGEKAFKLLQINDNIKNNYAKENAIDLLRIRYDEINNINQILSEFIK